MDSSANVAGPRRSRRVKSASLSLSNEEKDQIQTQSKTNTQLSPGTKSRIASHKQNQQRRKTSVGEEKSAERKSVQINSKPMMEVASRRRLSPSKICDHRNRTQNQIQDVKDKGKQKQTKPGTMNEAAKPTFDAALLSASKLKKFKIPKKKVGTDKERKLSCSDDKKTDTETLSKNDGGSLTKQANKVPSKKIEKSCNEKSKPRTTAGNYSGVVDKKGTTGRKRKSGSVSDTEEDTACRKRSTKESRETDQETSCSSSATKTKQCHDPIRKRSVGVVGATPKTPVPPPPAKGNDAPKSISYNFGGCDQTNLSLNCEPDQDKHNYNNEVASLVCHSEEMDFDNPVPEILQMVTDASVSVHPEQANDTMEMEVDSVPCTSSKRVIVIADTNVWIENMALIREILNLENFQPPSSLCHLHIVIPWMVLQEIDYNIHRNKTLSKRREFQNATKYIHSLLSKKDGRVRGQKATEAVIGIEFNELMADDSILNCVIQHDKHPQVVAVFITNDINLLNKAMVHNLAAVKAEISVLQTLRQLVSKHVEEVEVPTFSSSSSNSLFGNSELIGCTYATESPAQSLGTMDDIGMDIDDPMGEGDDFNNAISGCFVQKIPTVQEQPTCPTFDAVIEELRKSLAHIIVPKMVQEYGEDGWKFAIKIKPPFSVESGLKCIQVHWVAVFSFLFPSRGKEVVDELLEVFHHKPALHDVDAVRSWRLKFCRIALVFLSMNNTLVSKPRISETIKLLKSYIESA